MGTKPLTEDARLAASKLKHSTRWRAGKVDRITRLLSDRDVESLSTFQICLHCYGLFEVKKRGYIQRCRCLPETEEKWEGFDFKRKIVLCLCCGWHVAEAIARYSWLYAGECLGYALALNELARACVIPVGRHSIMNGYRYSGKSLETPKGLREAVRGLKYVAGGWQKMSDWADAELARKLRSVECAKGNPQSVWLIDYMIEVAEHVPRGLRPSEAIARDAFTRYLKELGVSRDVAEFVFEFASREA